MKLGKNRKYKTGTGWCFWRWTEVDSGYITRLHVLKTPWFAVSIHWLNHPDVEPYLHNHPVSFLSVILWGGYTEERLISNGKYGAHTADCTHNLWNFVRTTTFHKIVDVAPGTVTLCIMGPKTQEWGFQTPKGFVSWKEYYAQQRQGTQL